ncbi:MAG: hypothetical protein Q8O09_05700 [Bacillota bacterium]|nr:hypothetical protein [Bacillota bacterium]
MEPLSQQVFIFGSSSGAPCGYCRVRFVGGRVFFAAQARLEDHASSLLVLFDEQGAAAVAGVMRSSGSGYASLRGELECSRSSRYAGAAVVQSSDGIILVQGGKPGFNTQHAVERALGLEKPPKPIPTSPMLPPQTEAIEPMSEVPPAGDVPAGAERSNAGGEPFQEAVAAGAEGPDRNGSMAQAAEAPTGGAGGLGRRELPFSGNVQTIGCPLAAGSEVSPFLPGEFDGWVWQRVQYEGLYWHYITGENRGGGEYVRAVGVPGQYALRPPPHLRGFDRFAPARDGTGYWLSFEKRPSE